MVREAAVEVNDEKHRGSSVVYDSAEEAYIY